MKKPGDMVRRALGVALLVGCLAVPGAWGEGRTFSLGPLGVEIPSGWFPFPEGDGGWGFFTGGLPEGGEPFVSVMFRLPPDDGEFQEFRKQMEGSRQDPRASVDIVEAPGSVGPWPGTLLRFSVTMKEGEMKGKNFQGSLFFSQNGVSGDRRLMVLTGGDPALAREREGDVADLLGSLREGGASYVLSPDLLLERSPGEFNGAAALAVDDQGLVYVADWRQRIIRVLDAQGTLRGTWGKEGKGEPGTFAQIKALWGLPEGGVMVGDGGYGYDAPVLHECDATGNFRRRVELKGKADPPMEYMLSLSRNGAGELLVADGAISEGDRLSVLTSEGDITRSWSVPKLQGAAWEPSGGVVAITRSEDRMGLMVRFSPEGEPREVWNAFGRGTPPPGWEAVYFDPKSVAVDPCGRIAVLDTWSRAVWIYEPDGTLRDRLDLKLLARAGILEGLASDPQGNILVLDRGSAGGLPPRVLVLRRTEPCEPPKGSPERGPDALPSPLPDPTPTLSGEGAPELSPTGDLLTDRLEAWKKALELRRQAADLLREERRDEAIALYEKSLGLYEDAALRAYLEDLRRGVPLATPAPASGDKGDEQEDDEQMEDLPPLESLAEEVPETPELDLPEPEISGDLAELPELPPVATLAPSRAPTAVPEPSPTPEPELPDLPPMLTLAPTREPGAVTLSPTPEPELPPSPYEGEWITLMRAEGAPGGAPPGFALLTVRRQGDMLRCTLHDRQVFLLRDEGPERAEGSLGGLTLRLEPGSEDDTRTVTLLQGDRVLGTLFVVRAQAGAEAPPGESLELRALRLAFRQALEAYRQALARQDGDVDPLRKKVVLAWLEYGSRRP